RPEYPPQMLREAVYDSDCEGQGPTRRGSLGQSRPSQSTRFPAMRAACRHISQPGRLSSDSIRLGHMAVFGGQLAVGKRRRRSETALADLQLCRRPEITNLSIQRSLEGRPSSTAVDVSGEALVACDDVGVFQNSQHGRHHQITRSEALAVEVGFV